MLRSRLYTPYYYIGIIMESSIFSKSAASNRQMTSGGGAYVAGRMLGKINFQRNVSFFVQGIYMNAGLVNQIRRYFLRDRGKMKHNYGINN